MQDPDWTKNQHFSAGRIGHFTKTDNQPVEGISADILLKVQASLGGQIGGQGHSGGVLPHNK